MTSRPRRSAATKAKETISVHARWADSDKEPTKGGTMSSRRSNRTSGPSIDVRADSFDDDEPMPAGSRQRQAARGAARRSDAFEGGEIIHGKRDRGGKKSYVVESSPGDDDDEEEEEEAQIEVDDEDDDDDMEDAEEDAEGEEDIDMDAEGDIDMDVPPPSGPTIKISRSAAAKPSAVDVNDNDDDDDDLSDPGDSDAGDQTMGFGDETVGDEDAEGDEIEVAGELEEGDAEEGGDSDDEGGSDEGEPDLAKMTKRQRARFEEEPQEFMKLSDEVQAKKVFTAEELSMRRQEMARRRRNLSEKRNEEVKMETINKLLKKQAPKVNKKAAAAAAAGDGTPEDDGPKVSPVFVRWVSNKNGVSIGVPREIVNGPPGRVFRSGADTPPPPPPKMVEEVA